MSLLDNILNHIEEHEAHVHHAQQTKGANKDDSKVVLGVTGEDEVSEEEDESNHHVTHGVVEAVDEHISSVAVWLTLPFKDEVPNVCHVQTLQLEGREVEQC